jgi:hypothetical protein
VTSGSSSPTVPPCEPGSIPFSSTTAQDLVSPAGMGRETVSSGSTGTLDSIPVIQVREYATHVQRRLGPCLEVVPDVVFVLSLDEVLHDRLVVFEAGASFSHLVKSPLSRGTLDQIYLALRLAIIDHLDADRERLPVFLDEVFVNWDAPRRHAAFEILGDMARERQLFVFTCHPFFAEETAEHLDAERIDLTALRSDDKLMAELQTVDEESVHEGREPPGG